MDETEENNSLEVQGNRKRFLDELIAYYSADPVGRRGTKPSTNHDSDYIPVTTCYYRHPVYPERKCAIGRHIPDDKYSDEIEGSGVCGKVMVLLPQEIQDLGESFLAECQQLHDNNEHWDDKGLTSKGESRVRSIRLTHHHDILKEHI
jgi:hypothetical protein